MAKLDGKVAFVTGVARGQGRSHALTLAREGAAIIGIDICQQIDTVPYAMSTPNDLEETVRLVEEAGGKIHVQQADIRDLDAVKGAVDGGMDLFGRLDVVVANAATINGLGPLWEIPEQEFRDQWEVNVGGAWHTIKATVPTLLEQGEGGSIILTASMVGLASETNIGHYSASKYGVIGLMKNLSVELAPHSVRVNTVCPTAVNTPMIMHEEFYSLFSGGTGNRLEDALPAMQGLNALPVPFLEPSDVSKTVLYLACDDSRYVTGTNAVVDAGALLPFKIPHPATT
ncbi:NAD(P)-dependent oxidoreductase [Saccharopolyspora karakumensis]|uniref:NAD(P)-dependent oxidoreductase n=1 Tax=Saccharopolyspora karakumensis TaxID=2530386 RepID=A0A4R5BXV2_9PSEU|nr:mycofactocin-coupled SDR family oxidoreductase [Saccharopolyspora karakumensis]TDD90523.1 NAD(P)-dependent oxidoreductase [Saccharopolyspora karakumensis]